MNRVADAVGRWAWIPLLALSVGALSWGLSTGGFETVKDWFGQLCTSCIGLTWR